MRLPRRMLTHPPRNGEFLRLPRALRATC